MPEESKDTLDLMDHTDDAFAGMPKWSEEATDGWGQPSQAGSDEHKPVEEVKEQKAQEPTETKEEKKEEVPTEVEDSAFKDQKPYKEDGEDEEKDESKEEQPKAEEGEVTPETELVNKWFDVLVDEYGWANIPPENRPRDMKQFSDYIVDIIRENSVPQYAHPDIQALDEFVKNGGDPSTYLRAASEINYDNLSIDNEYDCQIAVAHNLKLQGFNDEQVANKLKKYHEAGLLKEEAASSLAILKNWSAGQKQAIVQQQQQQAQAMQQQEAQFVDTMAGVMANTKEVLGNQLSRRDKAELFDYMFTPANEHGMSKFAIEYASNPDMMIRNAYLCMKKDKALRNMQVNSEKGAMDRFRNTIAKQNVTRTKAAPRRGGSGKARPFWELTGI